MKKKLIRPSFLTKAYMAVGTLVGDNLKYLCEAQYECLWYWNFGLLSGMDYKHGDIDGWVHVDSTILTRDAYAAFPKLPMFTKHVFTSDVEVWAFIELFEQFYSLQKAAELIYSCGAHISTIKEMRNLYRSDELVHAGRKINRELIPEVIRRIYALLVPEGSTLTVSTPAYWGDWATLDEYLLCKKEKPWDTRLQAPRVLTCDEEQRLKEM